MRSPARWGVREIALHAQLSAKAFYARLGYREEGEEFEEAGIPHVDHAQDDRMKRFAKLARMIKHWAQ